MSNPIFAYQVALPVALIGSIVSLYRVFARSVDADEFKFGLICTLVMWIAFLLTKGPTQGGTP